MESTSDYWRIWFYLLEAAGLDVQLVNARDVKNVPGRPKTDKLDAVWLAKLTEKGMLRPSFVPPRRDPGAARLHPAAGRPDPRTHPVLAAAGEAARRRPDQGVVGGVHAGHAVGPGHDRGAHRRRTRPATCWPGWPGARMRSQTRRPGRGAHRPVRRPPRRTGPDPARPDRRADPPDRPAHRPDRRADRRRSPPPRSHRPRRTTPATRHRPLPAVQRLAEIPGLGRGRRPNHPRRDRPGHDPVPHRRAPGRPGPSCAPAPSNPAPRTPPARPAKATPTSKASSAPPPPPPPAPTPSSANATDAWSNAAANSKPSSPSPAPSWSSSGTCSPTPPPASTTSAADYYNQPHRQADAEPATTSGNSQALGYTVTLTAA